MPLTESERRNRRSADASIAMNFQLDACRTDAGLEAIVLSDEAGLCLAASGEPGVCEEIAVRASLVGSKVPRFDGVLFGPSKAWKVIVQRFEVEGAELFISIAGGRRAMRDDQVSRSMRGIGRILATA